MSLRIKLLGVLQIENETGEISEVMKSNKGCALLAYLLVTNASQPREMLADLLWNATSTAQSLQNLRALLTRLRKWVPELEVTRRQVRFPTETAVFIDYLQLLTGLDSGEQDEIASALPLYRGDLLDGFYLEDAPRFNEWLLLTREKLRQRVVGAFRQLCTEYQEQQDWVKGISLAQRWLALDELDEEALRHLLQLLAGSGQLDAALQQYELSQQRLWDELGVEPMDETQQLAAQISQLKDAHGGGFSWEEVVGTSTELPVSDELPEPGHLPSHSIVPYPRNPNFVGRYNILLETGKAFLPPKKGWDQRAVTFTGLGGLGKTQLVVEFCYRYGRFFPGGVFWLSFAEPENIDAQVAFLGSERGLNLFQDTGQLTLSEKVERVQKAWQQPIPRLLIFDNCENECYLEQWLPKTGGCRVLITSKRTHWPQKLNILSYPLPVLNPDESTQLLSQLTPTLQVQNAQAIADELGHLPLALHLAGRFLRRYHQITPAHYLQQLRDKGLLHHPSLQGRGIDSSPTGHELHVARTFALSLAQLNTQDKVDEMAQRLLQYAACFAPNEPIPHQLLIRIVLSGNENDLEAELLVHDGLSRLTALGFISSSDGQSFKMHRLVSAYTRDVFADLSIAQTAVSQAVCEMIDDESQRTASLYGFSIATTHLRHLTQAALPQGNVMAADLALRLGQHFHFQADYQGACDYLEQALAIYEQQTDTEDAIAKCRHHLGLTYFRAGDYWQGRSVVEGALAIYKETVGRDHPKTAMTFNNLGYIVTAQGDYETARCYLESALAFYEKEPEQYVAQIATSTNNLGITYLYAGELETAKSYLEESLKTREGTLSNNHPFTAVSYQNVGLLHLKLNAYAQAETFLKQALTIREASFGNIHPHVARSFNALAELQLALEHYESAKSCLEQAHAIQEAVFAPEHPEKALTFKLFGELYLALEAPEAARPYFERAHMILSDSVVPTHPDLLHVQNRLAQL